MPKVLDALRDLLGKVLGKERLSAAGRSIKALFKGVGKADVLHYTALGIVVLIAAIVRLLPIRWGFYLSEFDPYVQYRMTKFIVDHSQPTLINGFIAWSQWHDYMSWYPYGLKMYLHFPGVAFTNAFVYEIARTLGMDVTVFDVTVVFPVIAGALTCLVLYFFARDTWGKGVALLAALFLALNSAHISRTSLGFLRHETIGVLLLLVVFTFYLRAISPTRPLRSHLVYALLSGLSLGYLTASWAAALYPIALLAVFSLVLVVLRRSSRNLLTAYLITFGIALSIAVQVPSLGPKFLLDFSSVAVFTVLLILLANHLALSVQSTRNRLGIVAGVVLGVAVVGLILYSRGLITLPAGKFYSILNPTARLYMPIVESVAEHRPATWASFFHEFGVLTFFALFGLYQAIQRFKDEDIFLVIYAATSLYFSASFVRLTLILAPAFAVLGALAILRLARPAIDILKATGIVAGRRTRREATVGKELGVGILLILILLMSPTFYRAVNGAYAPATIVTSSIPTVPSGSDDTAYQDWLQAIMWIRDNTPKNSVVFAWWDYGYWITALGERHTLADNGTQNTTQIAVIATAFLMNESMAIPILQRYDVGYIAILATWSKDQQGKIVWHGVGEDGKWYWMARIGNGTALDGRKFSFYERRLGDEQLYLRVISVGEKVVSNETISTKDGLTDKTLLGTLMLDPPTGGEVRPRYMDLAYRSTNRFVLVYKVYHPASTGIDVSLDNPAVGLGENTTLRGAVRGVDPGDMSSVSLDVELSSDGKRWEKLTDVTPQPNGEFWVKWKPRAGNYTIRVKWDGLGNKYFPAKSEGLSLSVGKGNAQIACASRPTTIAVGEEVSIACVQTPAAGGHITIQYSLDGTNWNTIVVGDFTNDGKFAAIWKPGPGMEGNVQLRVLFGGTPSYNPATVSVSSVTVKKP